jgi:hypothetical protein
MRITVIAAALFATMSAMSGLASGAPSESMGLMMWGGGLIVLSLILRPSLTLARRVAGRLAHRKPVHQTPSFTQAAES